MREVCWLFMRSSSQFPGSPGTFTWHKARRASSADKGSAGWQIMWRHNGIARDTRLKIGRRHIHDFIATHVLKGFCEVKGLLGRPWILDVPRVWALLEGRCLWGRLGPRQGRTILLCKLQGLGLLTQHPTELLLVCQRLQTSKQVNVLFFTYHSILKPGRTSGLDGSLNPLVNHP